MSISAEKFLGLVDQFTQKLGLVDLLIDKLAGRFAHKVNAAAGCPGGFCGSTFQCVPGCTPPNGWVTERYVISFCGDCTISYCGGCCCS